MQHKDHTLNVPMMVDNRGRITEGLNCLSIDCGVSNFCYCLMEYKPNTQEEFEIHSWEVINLHAKDMSQATSSLVPELFQRDWMANVDYICIEKQCMENVDMKTLSHVVQMHFLTRLGVCKVQSVGDTKIRRIYHKRPTIHFVPPELKFKVVKEKPEVKKTKRRRTKVIAEKIARDILSNHPDQTYIKYLNGQRKIDDLCDSFLQGLYFLRKMHGLSKTFTDINKFLQQQVSNPPAEIFDTKKSKKKNELAIPRIYKGKNWNPPSYFNKTYDHAGVSRVYKRVMDVD